MEQHIKILIIVFLSFNTFLSKAQVGINDNNTSPDTSAMLDVKSTTKGMLIPRMTTTERTNISNSATGLLVFDNTTNSFWYYNGTTWLELIEGIHTQIADADNNTKIQVEETSNDNTIRFDISGAEIIRISRNANNDPIINLSSSNLFFGEGIGANNTGNFNTLIGKETGRLNTSGNRNTIIGAQAGFFSTTGAGNTFIGVLAGKTNVSGNRNVYLGDYAGGESTGSSNVSIGLAAGAKATGDNNVFIGEYSGGNVASLSNNVVVGYAAGMNMNGAGNVYLGNYTGANATGNNKLYIDNSSTASPLIYGEFDNNILTINGKVGIDTNAPQAKFHINGGSFWLGGTDSGGLPVAAGSGIRMFTENSNSVAYLYSYNYTNAQANDMTLQEPGGLLGIGRVPSTNKLEVNGNASKSSAGNWLANSDARLKKNIEPLSSEKMLHALLSLQGVTYEWNDTKTGNNRPTGIQYGFTAQNIQATFPTLVKEDNLGYLQTAYGTYDAMTIEAIRALNDKITTQNKIIELQNNKIQTLESQTAKINQLESLLQELKQQVQTNANTISSK